MYMYVIYSVVVEQSVHTHVDQIHTHTRTREVYINHTMQNKAQRLLTETGTGCMTGYENLQSTLTVCIFTSFLCS